MDSYLIDKIFSFSDPDDALAYYDKYHKEKYDEFIRKIISANMEYKIGLSKLIPMLINTNPDPSEATAIIRSRFSAVLYDVLPTFALKVRHNSREISQSDMQNMIIEACNTPDNLAYINRTTETPDWVKRT